MKDDVKSINALIALLDDPDEEIFVAVNNELLAVGYEKLQVLEQALLASNSLIQHDRLQKIILEIKNNSLSDRFVAWRNDENRSLIDGWILASSIQRPDISPEKVKKLYQKLLNDIWLELNDSLTSLEKTSVINHVFFDVHHFEMNISDLASPENCLLDNMLISKKGNHFTLLLLYYITVKQLLLPIVPVSFKRNILLAYFDPSVAFEAFGKDADPYLFYINPEHKGAIIGSRELEYSMQIKAKELAQLRVIEDDISLIKKLLYYLKRTMSSAGKYDKALVAERILERLEKK